MYFFHIRTVHLDIIKVLFIHQMMHYWDALKNNTKIYIYISIYSRTVQHTDTNKGLIHTATPPPY